MSFLDGKVALVTGGSRGIGRAIVLMLAQEGAKVAFSFASQQEAALNLQEGIKKLGQVAVGSRVDVKDFEQVKAWVEETKSRMGGVDILVNNAGIIRDKALMMMSPQDWDEVIKTNLTGMFNVSRCCIVTFLKQKKGDIVNISSVSGVTGLPRQSNYSASKGGVNAFTKSLAKEVAAFGVRVNAIAPGYIETEILSGLNEDQKQKIRDSIPLGRMGNVDEVAAGVKFLLSPSAQYMTGQIIQIDGGLAIR